MKSFNQKYVAAVSVVAISFTSFLSLPSAQAAPKNQARSSETQSKSLGTPT